MAKKKDLKDSINFACDELITACLAVSFNKEKEAAADKLMLKIQAIRQDFVKRLSHTEPGMEPKNYFKAVIEGFGKELDQLVEQINKL